MINYIIENSFRDLIISIINTFPVAMLSFLISDYIFNGFKYSDIKIIARLQKMIMILMSIIIMICIIIISALL